MSTARRFLGITVLSPYIQYEGVERVLSNIAERAGATALACNTSVTAPSDEGEGSFQPPDDAGASVRLFDRPLWGRQALWLRSAPGHHAREEFFADSPYKPRRPMTSPPAKALSWASLSPRPNRRGWASTSRPAPRTRLACAQPTCRACPTAACPRRAWLPQAASPRPPSAPISAPGCATSSPPIPRSTASARTGPSILAISWMKPFRILASLWQPGPPTTASTFPPCAMK